MFQLFKNDDQRQIRIATWIEQNKYLVQDSEDWHQKREMYQMTSSKAAAALGIDPHLTKSKLLALMRGQYFYESDYCRRAKQWGHDHEPVARDWLSTVLECHITTTGIHTWYKEKDDSGEHFFGFTSRGHLRDEKWYGGSSDGLIEDMDAVCEIKCPFTLEIPHQPKPQHVAQLFFNMACHRKQRGVLAYWSPQAMQVFFVKWDESVWQDVMLPALDDFVSKVHNINIKPTSLRTRTDEKRVIENTMLNLVSFK
jgi:hypothetical protein